MAGWDLIGDVGGTNARFAKLAKGKITAIETYDTKGDAPLVTLIERYLLKQDTKPDALILAVAGVVHASHVQLTNADQLVHIADLAALTQNNNAFLINDFEAAAWSLAQVGAKDVQPIQGPQKPPKGHRLIVGPGTGLGVGTLVDCGAQYVAVPGEGGHVGLSPQTDFEVQIFKAFKDHWPEVFTEADGLRIEAEGLLSGTGLPLFYKAVCAALDQPHTYTHIADLFKVDRATDKCIDTTLSLFSYYLGAIAGDLGLTVSAKGGVFLTGGVVLKNPHLLDAQFMAGFQKGGRHTAPRKNLPVYLFKNEQFGLEGAKNALAYKLSLSA